MIYKILLDTNILIDSFRFKIRLKEEFERVLDYPFRMYVVKGVIRELERLINNGGSKEKRFARLALDFIDSKVEILDISGEVDDNILELAKKGFIPCTSDKELKKMFKNNSFIILKQKKYLEFKNVL